MQEADQNKDLFLSCEFMFSLATVKSYREGLPLDTVQLFGGRSPSPQSKTLPWNAVGRRAQT